MNPHQQQRRAILKALYAAREAQPDKGWITQAELRDAAGPAEFALVYLVERGFIVKSGFSYRITAGGIDAVEISKE